MERRSFLALGLATPAAVAAGTSAVTIGMPADPAQAQAAMASGNQPYASYWHPNSILDWNPATDPDARFNRSRVSRRQRVQDGALRANPNARAGEGRVASLAAFAATNGNPSQGALVESYYAFGYWQYIDTLVFWGGSAGEGLILAPNATVIDAAHRNGVKVYGTVFFPPRAYGGQVQWIHDFVRKSGSTFPVADKMNQVARYYGFDGWFINQETAGGNSALAGSMRDFMRYARAFPTEFMWYDAMTTSGSVSWQNALTSANAPFLQENGSRVSDSMFLNFWWNSMASSAEKAQSLGRSPYDLYAGIDTEGRGYDTSVSWDGLFPNGAAHRTSLGIYRPEWTWHHSSGRDDFLAREARYWVGANSDPSNTATNSSWKGLAHYVAESSPVTELPFVTSFNTGQGDRYAVAGQTLATGGWNNLSLQDVLPTYRWIVGSSGTKLTPSLDFTDSYYGGSCLKVTGRLDAANLVRLYQTRLPVSAATKLSLMVKTPIAGPTHMSIAVSFTDAPTMFSHLPLGATSGTGWENVFLDLAVYAGRTIAQLGLYVAAPDVVADYTARVGQIALYDVPLFFYGAPTGLTVLGSSDIPGGKSLRLGWTVGVGRVRHFDVFRRNPDGTRTYLGGTPNDVYYVPRLERSGTEATTTIEVEAVSPTFHRSPAAKTTVSWVG